MLAIYAGSSYVVFEASTLIFPRWGLPDWTIDLVLYILILGALVTFAVSWIYDFTPEGIQKTMPISAIEQKGSLSNKVQRKLKPSDIIIGVLIIAVIILIYPRLFGKGDLFNQAFEGKKSIAVFPFSNHTGDSAYANLEYGISELLINELSTSPEITVLDNQTISNVIDHVRKIQKTSIGPSIANEVASRVRVESYITGDFMLSGSTFRINLKLIKSSNSEVMKTDDVEGQVDSIFSLTAILASNIKRYLEIKSIGGGKDEDMTGSVTTNSPEAYRHYIEGLECWWQQKGHPSDELFQALRIDSTFTEAQFICGVILSSPGYGEFNKARDMLLAAEKGKERLSGRMQLMLEGVMALNLEKNPYMAIDVFEEATELYPLSRINWFWLGWTYYLIEEYEDALQSLDPIVRLNRKLGHWKYAYFYSIQGAAHKVLGHYKKAERILKKGAELFPESHDIIRQQAIIALLQEDETAAEQFIKKLRNCYIIRGNYPEVWIDCQVGFVYNASGRSEQAITIYRDCLERRLEQGNEIDSIQPGNHLFWYYSILGGALSRDGRDLDEAIEYLERAKELSRKTYSYHHHPYIMSSLGWAYYQQGRMQEALQHLEQAEQNITSYNHRLYQYIREVEETIALQE
jgi:tetratricopeptide (TPR) repeat protein/TolB-like protein